MKRNLFIMASIAAIVTPAIVMEHQAEYKVSAAEVTTNTEFSDVPKSHMYYEVIMDMKERGVINGYGDGTFRPTETIKRSHVAALLSRSVELKPIREATEFSDVPKSHTYYNEIQQLYRAGIVDGVDGKFNPNGNLTRIQMAKILALAFNLQVKSDVGFPDIPEDHWGNDYVKALYSNKVTTGNAGFFQPSEMVSRQHYALFLSRALEVAEGNVVPEGDTPPYEEEPEGDAPPYEEEPEGDTPPYEEEPEGDTPPLVDDSINLEPTADDVWRTYSTDENELYQEYPYPKVPSQFGRTGQEHFDKQLEELQLYAIQFNQTGFGGTRVENLLANINNLANTTGYTKDEIVQIYNYAIQTGNVFKSERLIAFYAFGGSNKQNMFYLKTLSPTN